MRSTAVLTNLSIGALAAVFALACDSPTEPGDSPTEPGAISMALSERAVTLGRGLSDSLAVTVERSNFDKAVSLTIEGLPAGVTATFSPSSVPAASTRSTLHISVGPSASLGDFTLTVRASGEGVAPQTATINLSVTVRGQYALSVLNPSVTVAQGGAGSTTVLVTRSGGFTGDVSLAVAGAPAGVTVTLTPAAASGGAAELRITASASATPGTYSLTITSTSEGLSNRTATVSLVVIPPPSLANLTFNFCPEWAPIWFGAQNEGYAWQQVTPTGTTFSFAATEKVGLAWVFQFGSAFEVMIVYATRSEHLSADLDPVCSGTKSLSGSVAAVGANETAIVAMGGPDVIVNASSPTFSLTNLPTGPLDLVGTRGVLSGLDNPSGPAAFTPDRLIIRRSLDLPSGATIPVLDFASSEAFAPATSNLTITGREQGERVYVVNRLWSATSTFGTVYEARDPAASASLYSVPAAQLATGDLHELWIDAQRSGNELRRYVTYFGAPADRTDALGPSIDIPSLTLLGGSPYVRMRGQLAAQPQYGAAAKFIFGGLAGANRNVHVTVTAANLGGTPSTWDVAIPDLSGTPGFQTSWMPMPGQAPAYQIDAYSTVQALGRLFLGLPLFVARPEAGDVLRWALRGGPVGEVLQPSVQASRGPSLMRHLVR